MSLVVLRLDVGRMGLVDGPEPERQPDIGPVAMDTFRLVILASANPRYPNAAQLGEIELLPAAK